MSTNLVVPSRNTVDKPTVRGMISTLTRLPLPPRESLNSFADLDRLEAETQEAIQAEYAKGSIDSAKIKEALIRLDAAVLDSYKLPAPEQRRLLDDFDGGNRPAGAEVDRYFPSHFKDSITLSDLVAINYDWEKTNERRCVLIDKECSDILLSAEESQELEHLQHLADLLIRLKAPYETERANELIDLLKASGQWTD